MRFKTWFINEVGGSGPGGVPPLQHPDLMATALPTYCKADEPIPNKKSPTKGYVVGDSPNKIPKAFARKDYSSSSSSSKSSSSRSSSSSSSS